MIEDVHLKSVSHQESVFRKLGSFQMCGHEWKFMFLCHIMNFAQQMEGASQFLGDY